MAATGLSLSVFVTALLCVAGLTPHDGTLRYELVRSLRRETCSMCFGDNCWELGSPRCLYYLEAAAVLSPVASRGGDEELPSEVDPLMHDMMQQGAASWLAQECIPYVSQYTDCDKDNICVGCKWCACDAAGRWRCRPEQRCSAGPELDVDHHVLTLVMQALKRDNIARKKRYIEDDTEAKVTSRPQKLNYAEIMEWLYNVRPGDKLVTTINRRSSGKRARRPEPTTTKAKVEDSDTDYVDFDEVLNDVTGDKHSHKLKSNVTEKKNMDYMDLDDVAVAKNDSTQFVHMLNAIEDGNDTSASEESTTRRVASTKAVAKPHAFTAKTDITMNLINDEEDEDGENDTARLDAVYVMKREIVNTTFDEDSSNDTLVLNEPEMNLQDEYYSEDNDNETIKLDAVHVMKRDVSPAEAINVTNEVTTEKINSTTKFPCLTNNVLNPLNKIINDKEQELKDLIKIKENLMEFISSFKEHYNNMNTVEFNTRRQEIINSTNTMLSNYNLDLYPEIQYNLRKISPSVLDKLLYKLKRDIYEVIKDIVGLKKISNTSDLPDDLKVLIRAMSLYVRNNKNSTSLENSIKLNYVRRLLLEEDNIVLYNSTKDYLFKIIEILDKNEPKSEALISLSKTTKKIVKRVIKNNYVDNFSAFGLKVYEPGYNFTNDLKDIGKRWLGIAANVASYDHAHKLYAIKLLHLSVSSDINKLAEAYALLDFADSRRMAPIDENIGEKLMDNMFKVLRIVRDKIDSYYHFIRPQEKSELNPSVKEKKKKSFLKKIRNLLKGSKKDIAELVRQKVPRKEIVHTIAKKRLDELSKKNYEDYYDTMTKWQRDLNVVSRYRRSTDTKSRMNNIIPKYLRGKLNPAIAANKKSKKLHPTMHTPIKLTTKSHQVTKKTPLKHHETAKRLKSTNKKTTNDNLRKKA